MQFLRVISRPGGLVDCIGIAVGRAMAVADARAALLALPCCSVVGAAAVA